MKLIPLTFLALSITGVALADEPVGFQQGMTLLTKYNCQTCHSVDKAMAGPSLHAVAKRYASDPHARSVLSESILNGSSGTWDSAASMPPTKIPNSDLRPLVDWILSLNQY
jgi:cytochrome c